MARGTDYTRVRGGLRGDFRSTFFFSHALSAAFTKRLLLLMVHSTFTVQPQQCHWGTAGPEIKSPLLRTQSWQRFSLE